MNKNALGHGECSNFDKIFVLLTLSKIAFEMVNNVLGDQEKIVNSVSSQKLIYFVQITGLMNSLFAILKVKDQKDQLKQDLSTEILLGFLN